MKLSRPHGGAAGVLILGMMSMVGFLALSIAGPFLQLDPWIVGAAGMVPFALLGWWAGTEGLGTVALISSAVTVIANQLGMVRAGIPPMGILLQLFGVALLVAAMALAARARSSTEGQKEAFARLIAQSAETAAMLELQRAIAESASALLTEDPSAAVRASIHVVHSAVHARAVYVASYEDGSEGVPADFEWFDGQDARGDVSERPWHGDSGLVNSVDGGRWEYIGSPGGDSVDAVIPITAGGVVSGLMGIVTDPDRRFTSAEEAMLRTVAELVGVAWNRRRAADRLEDLLRSKDRFIAAVSHELRTPLAVIVGLSLEMRDDLERFEPVELGELIALLAQQGEELRDLIEDLLVGARAEESQLTVFTEDIDFSEVVSQVLGALPAEVMPKIVSCDTPPRIVVADALRLRQIIRNLVMNAHRHGGPAIRLSVGEENELGVLRVTDNGPGIPDEFRDAIFSPYGRVSADPGRPDSIGLGLTVSRQLARLMGGDIAYRSDAVGSTFVVSLPLSPAGSAGVGLPSDETGEPGALRTVATLPIP